jgi:RES domain-containing protein
MSGIGSHQAGGRWNTPGHHVVYASGNLTLAMLELLVHIDDAERFREMKHVYHAVRFPEDAVAILEEPDLPAGWNDRPESTGSTLVGDEWLEQKQSPILAVPSVLVPPALRYDPIYMTYLINPGHDEYEGAVATGEIHDLEWDPRLAN